VVKNLKMPRKLTYDGEREREREMFTQIFAPWLFFKIVPAACVTDPPHFAWGNLGNNDQKPKLPTTLFVVLLICFCVWSTKSFKCWNEGLLTDYQSLEIINHHLIVKLRTLDKTSLALCRKKKRMNKQCCWVFFHL